MRKYIGLIAVVTALLLTMAGCGGGGAAGGSADSASPADLDSLKTMADVIALEKEEVQKSVGAGRAIIAFKYGDTYYRAVADISEDVQEKYFAVDMSKDDFEKEENDILAPLEIKSFENLSEQMLSDDELGALKGKSGQELFDEGWTCQGSYMYEDSVVMMDFGPFTYNVSFEGKLEGSDSEDFDISEYIKDKKVKSAEFAMLGSGATE